MKEKEEKKTSGSIPDKSYKKGLEIAAFVEGPGGGGGDDDFSDVTIAVSKGCGRFCVKEDPKIKDNVVVAQPQPFSGLEKYQRSSWANRKGIFLGGNRVEQI